MKNSIVAFISFFLFHAIFIRFSIDQGTIIQGISLFPLLLFAPKILNCFLSRDYRSINLIVLLYCMVLLLSSYLSNSTNIANLSNLAYANKTRFEGTHSSIFPIMVAVRILLLFAYIQFFNKIGKVHILFKVFFVLSVFYLFFTFLFYVAGISTFVEPYLIGNKFTVSYLAVFCSLLYCLTGLYSKGWFNKSIFYLFLFIAFFISIITECFTALVGCVFVFFAFSLKSLTQKFIYKQSAMIFIIILSALFPFFYNLFLEIPFIQYVITDLMSRNLDLTGRVYIYENMSGILSIRPLWGWGIDKGLYYVGFMTGYPNAQNGMAQMIVEQGFIGVIVFCLLIKAVTVYKQKEFTYRDYSYPAFVYLYMFAILATVEITFGHRFISYLALLLANAPPIKTFEQKI